MKTIMLMIALFIGISALSHAQNITIAPDPITIKPGQRIMIEAKLDAPVLGVNYTAKWTLPDGKVFKQPFPAKIQSAVCTTGYQSYTVQITGTKDGKVVYTKSHMFYVYYL